MNPQFLQDTQERGFASPTLLLDRRQRPRSPALARWAVWVLGPQRIVGSLRPPGS